MILFHFTSFFVYADKISAITKIIKKPIFIQIYTNFNQAYITFL